MKILTFTTLFPNQQMPNLGVFIKHRTQGLLQLGNEVKVVAPVPYFPSWSWLQGFRHWYTFAKIPRQEMIQDLITFHPQYFLTPKIGMSWYGIFMYWSVLRKIEEIRKTFKFDVIDAHYVYPDGLAAVWLGEYFQVPVVLSARGSDIHQYVKYYLIRKWLQYIVLRTQSMIAVGQNLLDTMVEIGASKDKMHLIPNGIDPAMFYWQDQQATRKKLGLDSRSKIVVSVGALVPRKNFHCLLEAMAQLKHGEKLYIIGKGQLRDQLQQRIQTLKLQERVFLLGSLPQAQIQDWYCAADLFCFASLYEGSPNVVYEALGCGTPVVASKLPGTEIAINGPHKGILVDPITSQNFAKAIDEALWQQHYDRQAISKEAHQRTWATVAQEVQEVLTKAIAEFQKPSR